MATTCLLRGELLRTRLTAAPVRGRSPSDLTRLRQNLPILPLGQPGRPAPFPTLLMCLADDSASVSAPTGADPISNRYSEMRHAFQAVARRGSGHELGAVLHFDTPTTADVPPTALTRTGLHRINSGLCSPPDAAGVSLLGPSLTAAYHLAESYPNHRATLVVLSDFELFDTNLTDIMTDLTGFPDDVRLVVLGRQAPQGLDACGAQVTSVPCDAPPGAVATALFASLTTHRPGAHRGG